MFLTRVFYMSIAYAASLLLCVVVVVSSCLFGGEGLVMKITGPTVVYSQNRSPTVWKKIINQVCRLDVCMRDMYVHVHGHVHVHA